MEPITYILTKVDENQADSRRVDLTSSDMEWILNALRGAQEQQQQLATERRDQTLRASDIGPGSSTPDAEVSVGEIFLEQHSDVTRLRELLVGLVGYDMTDEGV